MELFIISICVVFLAFVGVRQILRRRRWTKKEEFDAAWAYAQMQLDASNIPRYKTPEN